MKTIQELTKYFGYYKSNSEFKDFLDKILLSPTPYDSQTLYLGCRASKLEIGFTNERMIRATDKDKPLIGGLPVFTHFNIYPGSFSLFENLPFGIEFSDPMEKVREKAGHPTRSIDKKIPFIGWNRMDTWKMESISISIKYNPENNAIEFIQVSQKPPTIVETSKNDGRKSN